MKQNILFLCTGNSARSQMAEGLMRQYSGERFEVYSAGLEPKGINPYAIKAMDEIGIDIRGQRSKGLKEYMGRMFFHYLITLCGHADTNCPQALWAQGGVKMHWPFEDPAAVEGTNEAKLAAFRETRNLLEVKLKSWMTELEKEPA